MNVGQILETHLGWAAKGVGCERLNEKMEASFNRAMKLKNYDPEYLAR